jgi:cardiolipin synthase A/B
MGEDEPFARKMEDMYREDLGNATEIVLDTRNRVRAPGAPPRGRLATTSGGSGGRAVAGAFRIGSTVSAAVTNRRVLEPVEGHIAFVAGGVLAALALLAFKFPRGLAYPLAVLAAWISVALLVRGFALVRERRRGRARR